MGAKYKAVIFDVDGTLTTTNSWNDLTSALGASEHEHHKIYLARKAGIIPLEQARQLLLSLWKNTGNANEKYMRSIFKKTKLRPDVQQTVTYLHNNGYDTCLITGSNNLFAREIAKMSGIRCYYSNANFKFDPDGNITGYDYEINQGEKKLEQLIEFCTKKKIEPEDCVVVGDGSNDIEMMKSSGLGIAVKTEQEDQEIEKYARYKIKNLSEITKIL